MVWRAAAKLDPNTLNLLKTSMGEEGFASCCIEFSNELRRLGQDYKRLRDVGDMKAACDVAHSLKGAAMNIGLMQLGMLASEYEVALHKGELPEGEEHLDDTLASALNALEQVA